jgi:hypothetical protein
MRIPDMGVWFTSLALIAAPHVAAADPALSDGTWIVVERCGENPHAQEAAQKRPFDRRTELTIEKGHIAGHERSVDPRNKAVTTIAYDGRINGDKITLTGNGSRSNLKMPWTYAYGGTVTVDGHAELTGSVYMRLGTAADAVPLRSCSIVFLGPKDTAAAKPN